MTNQESPILYTIGYSRFPMPEFVNVLKGHGISTLIDVRSVPYGSRFRYFNRDRLPRFLKKAEIGHIWLGDKLGGLKGDAYAPISTSEDMAAKLEEDSFRIGCALVRQKLDEAPVCLMCAENDPINCHRAILISHLFRSLYPETGINHIWKPKGGDAPIIEVQEDLDKRVLSEFLQRRECHPYSANEFDTAYATLNARFASKKRNIQQTLRNKSQNLLFDG